MSAIFPFFVHFCGKIKRHGGKDFVRYFIKIISNTKVILVEET